MKKKNALQVVGATVMRYIPDDRHPKFTKIIMPHPESFFNRHLKKGRRHSNMSISNGDRKGCKDVFHAYFVEDAKYDGEWEMPFIEAERETPEGIISFSKAMRTDDYNQWVHFYEDDVNFERLWNRPGVYLPKLKKFKGVISPDFSLYRDMPLVMQAWNTYRNRATGHWLQSNGIKVIPNVRWGDERTYDFCCLGVRKKSVIAVGTHGTLKRKEDRHYFEKGLEYVISELEPSVIIVYGAVPESIFKKYIDAGIIIIPFESDFGKSHKGGDD